jgi:Methyltransferase domain
VIACCKKVIPQNAARIFSSPAPILLKVRVRDLLKTRANGRGVEIGAGCLRNSLYLLGEGFKVTAIDLPGIEERFPAQYRRFRNSGGSLLLGPLPKNLRFDFGVCTFVIETICEPTARLRLLKSLISNLSKRGFLILSTRGPADVVTAHAKGTKCSDGFLTPQRTFVRSYTRTQLDRLLRSVGFPRIEFLHKRGTKSPELLHAIAFKEIQ